MRFDHLSKAAMGPRAEFLRIGPGRERARRGSAEPVRSGGAIE